MIVEDKFSGLLLEKKATTGIIYAHSGFLNGISTAANDLPFVVDLSRKNDCTILSVEYDSGNIDHAISNINKAYNWLVSKDHKRIVMIGSGGGGYLIQLMLCSEIFEKKSSIDVILISPIINMSTSGYTTRQSNLDKNAIEFALSHHKNYKIDYKKIVKQFNKVLVIYGDNDMFKPSAKYLIKQLEHYKKSKVLSVKGRGTHCFVLSDYKFYKFSICYRNINQFIQNKKLI